MITSKNKSQKSITFTNVLLDSKLSIYFIHANFVKKYKILLVKKIKLLYVGVIDGCT